MEGSLNFVSVEEYEKEKFIKVFVDDLAPFLGLNTNGHKVLYYVFTKLEMGKDFIYFDYDEAKSFTKIKSDANIVRGISDLIKNNLIARTKKTYMYFINPTVFFNGDRINFVKSIRRKKDKSYKDEKQLSIDSVWDEVNNKLQSNEEIQDNSED
jgi:hypothetical protein